MLQLRLGISIAIKGVMQNSFHKSEISNCICELIAITDANEMRTVRKKPIDPGKYNALNRCVAI